ncbi:MAG: FAD-dependent oxidoreductase [Elusimicrobiota bacterium]
MKRADVVVIGGSAAGVVAATTGRAFYPNKEFLVIRKEDQALVPCGIPYIFGTLGESGKDLMPDAALKNAGVGLTIDEIVSVDPKRRVCATAQGAEIGFEKLIIATGSTPADVDWLEGARLENVFTIPKSRDYLDTVKSRLDAAHAIVVIGGGFIGVELADELRKTGKDVTIVEVLPHVLSLAFDDDLAVEAEKLLASRGVKVRANCKVVRLLGTGKVDGVELSGGERIKADVVLLCMGYRPCSDLARRSGIGVNDRGFIKVNEYMQTANRDIFAVGDCAEKVGFFSRSPKNIMLASTSCTEGRIAGMNLYSLSRVRLFGGTLSIFCTAIGDCAFGAAGLIEKAAKEEGVDFVTGAFQGIDKHPGTLPHTSKQTVKLVVSREAGLILGGEVMGGASAGELVNLIGFAMQNQMTVHTLLAAQIGTHPLLTAPPTAYPLIKAAEAAVVAFRR